MQRLLPYIIATLLLCLSANTHAAGEQKDADNEDDWQEFLFSLYDGEEEAETKMEEAYEYLTELERNPLDINTATQEDLQAIPSVTTEIAKEILLYRSKYGRIRAIDELAMMPSIEWQQRGFLSHFLCVKEETDRAWTVKQNITLTAAIPSYLRAADKGSGSSKYDGKYLGDPTSHSLRYSMSIGEHIALNLTGAKGAAEPFFSHGNSWGYDRYAYNISLSDIGPFRKIVLGKFKAQYGLGLVLNNGFSTGKEAMVASAATQAHRISPHSSASDSKHLQGISAMAAFGNITLSAFFSYRFIDCTLNNDSSISTILTSPYHRTAKEMEKKNNATQMTAGTHIALPYRFRKIRGSIGASFLFSHLNRPLLPEKPQSNVRDWTYRHFYPSGSSFWNASVDYSLAWKWLALCGETATGDSHSIATLNTLTITPSKLLSFTAMQRYYAYQYYSLYSSAISAGGAVQNESGVYLGTTWHPKNNLTFSAYGDIAYFPWKKYRISSPSYAYEAALSSSYEMKKWSFNARYRYKSRQQDIAASKGGGTAIKHTHSMRLMALLTEGIWSSRTQLEGMLYRHTASSAGFVISEAVTTKPMRWLTATVHAAYFNTQDYDSRLYIYERAPRYSFGYSSYYGHGMRAALMVQCKCSRNISLMGKIAHTRYFDRSSIGTAEREIAANNITDFYIQLNIKL